MLYKFKKPNPEYLIIILISTLLFAYLANNKFVIKSGDTIAAKYVALSLIHEKNFDLNEYSDYLSNEYPYDIISYEQNQLPYFLIESKRLTKTYITSTHGFGVSLFLIFLFLNPFKIYTKFRDYITLFLILSIILNLFIIYDFFYKENINISQYMKILPHIENRSRVLPINNNKDLPVKPMEHMWGHLGIQKGIITPESFANVEFIPLEFKHKLSPDFFPKISYSSQRKPLYKDTIINFYDHIIVWGNEWDL